MHSLHLTSLSMHNCLSWSAQGNWYERHCNTLRLARIHTLLSWYNLPRRSLELSSLVKKFAVDPIWVLICCRDTCKSILFLTVVFMGLRCVVPLPSRSRIRRVCLWEGTSEYFRSVFLHLSFYLLVHLVGPRGVLSS